MTAGVEMALLV